MHIHREGRKIILVLFIFIVSINAASFYFFSIPFLSFSIAILSLIFFSLVLYFFRNPDVDPTLDDHLIIAPADGKIVSIQSVIEEEYFKDERIIISIFMSPLNVHVNRNPASGFVKYFKYHAGKYLVAWHPKSSTKNERTTVVIEDKNGIEILYRQIAGAVAKRIRWYIRQGDQVKQGDEFGFIKFGSRVDVFLPQKTQVVTQIGDKTKGGKTILAKLG